MSDLPDPKVMGAQYRKIAPVWAVPVAEAFAVETLEGTMHGKAGDYLCEGPGGERWPCDRAIFEATHERAEDGPC